MMGKIAADAAAVFVQLTQVPMTPEEYLRERETGLELLFPTAKLMPGKDARPGAKRALATRTRRRALMAPHARANGAGARGCVLRWVTGAERLVRHLSAHAIPMAVATSSLRRHFLLKSQSHAEIFGLMQAIVTGDDADVLNGKPAPDIFLAAAKRLSPPPHAVGSVLVFEDAPNGVTAAVAAGMPVVMVPDPRVSAEDRQAATQVLKSLVDFDPAEWGLPPFA